MLFLTLPLNLYPVTNNIDFLCFNRAIPKLCIEHVDLVMDFATDGNVIAKAAMKINERKSSTIFPESWNSMGRLQRMKWRQGHEAPDD